MVEYFKHYDGPVYDQEKGEFHDNMEDYLKSEGHAKKPGQYLLCCEIKKGPVFDAKEIVSHIIEDFLLGHDESYRDELVDLVGLEENVLTWMDRQPELISYQAENCRQVEIPMEKSNV